MCQPEPSAVGAPEKHDKPSPPPPPPPFPAAKDDQAAEVAAMAAVADWWCCGLLGTATALPPKSGQELGVWEKSLEDRADIINWFLLSYLNPFLKLGSNKVLDVDDIGVPSEQDRAGAAYHRVLFFWNEQLEKTRAANSARKATWDRKLDQQCRTEEERQKLREEEPPPEPLEPNLAMALFKGFGVLRMSIGVFFYFISQLLTFFPVLILGDLVKFFQSNGMHKTYIHPWAEVVGLMLVPFLVSIMQARYQVLVAHAGVFVRAAVSLLLYHKSLKVSAAGRAKTSTGQVVNIMSNDSQQLQRLLMFAGMTLVAPFQIVLALALIYRQVGNATWAGVGFMLILAPINAMVFGTIGKLRQKVLKYSDSRVKLMNEVLTGIRIIKFYAWEKPFGKEVDRLRGKELQALTKYSYFVACIFSLILSSVPFVQPILVFSFYTRIQKDPLDAATAFTTIALFNIMRIPFAFLPMGFLQLIQSKIALKRIGRYLELPELNAYVQQSIPPSPTRSDTSGPEKNDSNIQQQQQQQQAASVTIRDGTFAWMDPSGKLIRAIEDGKTEAATASDKKKKKKKEQRRRSKSGCKTDKDNSDDDDHKSTEFADKELQASIHSLQNQNSEALSEDGSTSAPVLTLRNITTTIPAGALVAVVGPVGSGKSSFLSAILGEMEPVNDSKVYIPRNDDTTAPPVAEEFTSYCAQTPWVVNDTLQGNILFGRPYDEDRYQKVIEAAALLDDLAVLPAGDLTEIGENGINLSGGQKARVSLARALYSPSTKLVLLDDILSAVDSHVGEHLFTNAICGEVSKGATRILVTHAAHVLSRCDYIIVMDRGTIQHQGSYTDLIAQGVSFAGAVDVSQHHQEEVEDLEEAADEVAAEKKEIIEDTDERKEAMKKSGTKLVLQEEKEGGKVAGSAYMNYARAGGFLAAVSVLCAAIYGRGSDISGAFWLSRWAQEGFKKTSNGLVMSDADTRFYLGIYAAFALSGLLGITAQGICFANLRLRASRVLHRDLTASILRAPVAFFDITPIGRVLNRFASDMDKVDLELVQSLQQGISMLFNVLGSIGAIIAATKGAFLLPMIPLGYVYYLIQRWFRRTSTELQRITSINNSPIFADFSQTLSGTPSIRAYGAGPRFSAHCEASFDKMSASYILVQVVSQWLALRLDVLGGMVGFFIGAFAMGTRNSAYAIPAGWVGLALNYSIELTGYLKFGVRMIAQVEADMSSVERILYYSHNIESEAPHEIPEKDPPAGSWPTKGEIEFRNASMRYRNGPLVLKGVSLKIKPGEKIGICGRTGSGKSSLMISLFRISEIERDGGQILIDGIDTSEIGTSALRLNLSIIPQDPVMFSNTIRYNLDPFGFATEEELWTVLKKVEMVDVVGLLPNGLDHMVSEGGENFSLGQRQLICIARSLLRKPKVLVMDEATASIDNTTDATIQKMIRENFKDATVLTIAHRLNTIMDSDRVLVMDDGEVAEFDEPGKLLRKPEGHFASMVAKSQKAHDQE